MPTPTEQKIRSFMQEHSKDFEHINKTFFKQDDTEISGIYIDLPCLKDPRLGMMLALCRDDQERQYLQDHLREYNNRHSRSFMEEAYPDFHVDEKFLQATYYGIRSKEDGVTDLVFNFSPDTTLLLFLSSFIQVCMKKRASGKTQMPLGITINCWPLRVTNMVKLYGKMLEQYFKDQCAVSFISQDPVKLNQTRWFDWQVFFFDSLVRLFKPESTIFKPFFQDTAFFNYSVYAPYEIDPTIYPRIQEEGIDLSNEEDFVARFEPTKMYLNLLCKFSYLSFDIPLHEEHPTNSR